MKKFISLLLYTSLFARLTAQQIKVSYTAETFKGPFSGKVLLFLSKDSKEPRKDASGLAVTPCFAIEVKNIQPGQAVVFDDAAVSFPAKLSDIERGKYYAQAVWNRNLGERAISEAAGNIYNTTTELELTKDAKLTYTITCTKVVQEKKFIETATVKELRVPSALLTRFYNRPVTLDAAVKLPAAYASQPNIKYPVLFIVFGFGGITTVFQMIQHQANHLIVLFPALQFILMEIVHWGTVCMLTAITTAHGAMHLFRNLFRSWKSNTAVTVAGCLPGTVAVASRWRGCRPIILQHLSLLLPVHPTRLISGVSPK